MTIVDSETNSIVAEIHEGISSHIDALEYNPNNNNLYVANSREGTVYELDSTTNRVIEKVFIGQDDSQVLEYNPYNNFVCGKL